MSFLCSADSACKWVSRGRDEQQSPFLSLPTKLETCPASTLQPFSWVFLFLFAQQHLKGIQSNCRPAPNKNFTIVLGSTEKVLQKFASPSWFCHTGPQNKFLSKTNWCLDGSHWLTKNVDELSYPRWTLFKYCFELNGIFPLHKWSHFGSLKLLGCMG